mmetsp:Transcript_6426/g.15582  ORF Transcript_6426/g.15582 Transcript_6426/m.15582 type:complete len:1041 (-) Transcript_6426:49-3171(-)
MAPRADEGTFLTAPCADELEETEDLLMEHTAGKATTAELQATLRPPAEEQSLLVETPKALPAPNSTGQQSSGSQLRGKLRALRNYGPCPGNSGRVSKLDEKLYLKAQFRHKDDYYRTFPLAPGCFFWRAVAERGEEQLTKTQLQNLQVPFVETLVCAGGVERVLFSPSPEGVKLILGEKATSLFLQHADQWSNEAVSRTLKTPSVLRKSPEGNPGRSLSTVIEYQELQYSVTKPTDLNDVMVFQRFVLPRAEAAPSLLRLAWRDGMVARGFRIKARLSPAEAEAHGLDVTAQWTVSSSVKGATAIELRSVPPQAEEVLNRMAHFLQCFFHMRYEQVVIDLVQDRIGEYHFVQVKSFTPLQQWLDNHLAICDVKPVPAKKGKKSAAGMRTAVLVAEKDIMVSNDAYTPAQSSRAPKPVYREPIVTCGMCSCTCPKSRATKRITPKMMLETEHHLRKRGVKLFRGGRLRTFRLCSTTLVCDTCWALFLAESELQTIEAQLAVAVGITAAAEAFKEDFVPFSGIVDPVPLHQLQANDPQTLKPPRRKASKDGNSSEANEGRRYALTDGSAKPSESARRPASTLRQSGSAVQPRTNMCADDVAQDAPHLRPAPSNILQWRLFVYLDRLMDTDPDIMKLGKSHLGKLCLQMEMPWGWHQEMPLVIAPDTSDGEVPISKAVVHFVFSDPAATFPLHNFLSEVQPRFSLVWRGRLPKDRPQEEMTSSRSQPARQLKRPSTLSTATPREEAGLKAHSLLSGNISLARMLESPHHFVAESWVKLFSEDLCRQASLRLTLGLVTDKVVSSDYVVLEPVHEEAWVPAKPYFSSDLLPTTWMAIIKSGQRRGKAARAGDDAAETANAPAAAQPTLRRAASTGALAGTAFKRQASPATAPLRSGALLLAPRPSAEARAVAVAVKQANPGLRRSSTISTVASVGGSPSSRSRSFVATTEDPSSRPSSAPRSRPWSASSLPAQGSSARMTAQSRPWSAETYTQRRSVSASTRSRPCSAERGLLGVSQQHSILEAELDPDCLLEESQLEASEMVTA